MATVSIMVIFILFITEFNSQITFVHSFTKPCNASVETVQRVPECPTNLTAHKNAAKRKNCSALATNAMHCDSFQYHCVLSENLEHLVEVCAPSFNIIGFACAKFSSILMSLIRVHGTNCSDGTYECPFSYLSTDAYKYPHCYTNRTDIQHLTTEMTQRSENMTIVMVDKTENMTNVIDDKGSIQITYPVVVTATAVVIVIIVIIVCCLWRQKRKDKKSIFGLLQLLRKSPNEENNACEEKNGYTMQRLLNNAVDAKSGEEETLDIVVRQVLNQQHFNAKTKFCDENRLRSLDNSNKNEDISNAKPSQRSVADSSVIHKNRALYNACFDGNDSIAKLLLDSGADVNSFNGEVGFTALYAACQNGHYSTVKLLLKRGADVNLGSNVGDSPLGKASEEGHESIVKLLLDSCNN